MCNVLSIMICACLGTLQTCVIDLRTNSEILI